MTSQVWACNIIHDPTISLRSKQPKGKGTCVGEEAYTRILIASLFILEWISCGTLIKCAMIQWWKSIDYGHLEYLDKTHKYEQNK